MQSDQELLERVRRQDPEAFEALFARYKEPIRRLVTRMVRDQSAADDLVQEVFLRVWTCAEQWDGRGSVRAWLFRIASNQALNLLRTVRRRREQQFEAAADLDEGADWSVPGWMVDASSLGPEAALELAIQRDLLGRLLDKLPEEKREVIRLVHEAEMGIDEAAAVLGIPEGTVKSRLHYALKRLARDWGDANADEEE